MPQTPERRKEYIREYYKTHKRIYKPEWELKKRLRKRGLTEKEFEDLKRKHQGKCAICGAENSIKGRDLNIDHDHKTGAIRGLLCTKCNWGIGQFNDDVELLQKAIVYLSGNGGERMTS